MKVRMIPLSKKQSPIYGRKHPIRIQYSWIYLQIHVSKSNGILFLANIPFISKESQHTFRVRRDSLEEGMIEIMDKVISSIELNSPDKIKLIINGDEI